MVDDSALVLRSLSRVLRRYLDVTTAEGVEAAMELLEDGLQVDVVSLDLDMPPHDGRMLWRWIAERRPDLSGRMLLLSGGSSDPSLEEWRRALPHRYRKAKGAPVEEIVAALAALVESK